MREWRERRDERRHTRVRLLRAEWRFTMLEEGVDVTNAAAVRESLVKFIIDNNVTKKEAKAMIQLGATK